MFQPVILDKDFQFAYAVPFEERTFQINDSISLHNLFFKADSSQGLVYYLHGSGGSLENLGNLPELTTDNQYDLVAIDYRGFGKTGGEVGTQENYINDSWQVFEELAQIYDEENIVLYGYSFGTGLAAEIAAKAEKSPQALILEAPFYSYDDLMEHQFPWFLPSMLITDYNFDTDEIIDQVNCPVYLYHGKNDSNIYHQSSLKLKEIRKDADMLILPNTDHFGIKDNIFYQNSFKRILNAGFQIN